MNLFTRVLAAELYGSGISANTVAPVNSVITPNVQSAIDAGWMSVIPQSHYHPTTGVLVLDPPQPRVTPKGLQRLLTDWGVAA